MTDANVLLGRIQPHLFPAIFGRNENEPLDYLAALQAFEELTQRINLSLAAATISSADQQHHSYSVDEVAYGFIKIANEAMARPIRNLTTMKGYDATQHTLVR